MALLSVGAFSISRILGERNRATHAQREAEKERRQTNKARLEVAAERDNLILAQARSALSTDPTESIAWLKRFNGKKSDRVSIIAELAQAKGVALIAERAHKGIVQHIRTDGQTVLTGGQDGLLLAFDVNLGVATEISGDLLWGEAFDVDWQKRLVWFVTDRGDLKESRLKGTNARTIRSFSMPIRGLSQIDGTLRVLTADGSLTLHRLDSGEQLEPDEGIPKREFGRINLVRRKIQASCWMRRWHALRVIKEETRLLKELRGNHSCQPEWSSRSIDEYKFSSLV